MRGLRIRNFLVLKDLLGKQLGRFSEGRDEESQWGQVWGNERSWYPKEDRGSIGQGFGKPLGGGKMLSLAKLASFLGMDK